MEFNIPLSGSNSPLKSVVSSFVGVIVGFIMIIVAFGLLIYNEGRSIKRYRTLKQGEGVVISLADASVLDENEGQLVHLTGEAVTDEILTDPQFAVSVNAIRLKRVVEMYQWYEKETKNGDSGKSYSYRKKWSSETINSNHFKRKRGHQNPSSMPYRSRETIAASVTLGEFTLSASLVKKMKHFERLGVDPVDDLEGPVDEDLIDYPDGYYLGDDPERPAIGDVRIRFRYIPPSEVSVVARQFVYDLTAYKTANGGKIELIQAGSHTAEAMFKSAHFTNTLLTWGLRAAGFFAMLMGFLLVKSPLMSIGGYIPFLGAAIRTGIGWLALFLSGSLTLLTIAIAWLFFRPLISIALIAAVTVMVLLIVLLRREKEARPAKAPAKAQLSSASRTRSKTETPSDDFIGPRSTIDAPATKTSTGRNKTHVWLKKGIAYAREGNFRKAVAAYSKAISCHPKNAVAHYNLGVVLHKLGKMKQALAALKTAAGLGHTKAQGVLKAKRVTW